MALVLLDKYRKLSGPWAWWLQSSITETGWKQGLAIGYLAGLTGLLIECNALVIFLLTRVAGVFWFVTALVVWLAMTTTPRLAVDELRK